MSELPPMALRIVAGQRRVQKTAGVTITYRDGDQVISGVKAIPGKSSIPIVDPAANLGVMFESHDWFIVAEDLVIGETRLIPKRGAVIEALGNLYTVSNPNRSEAPFRYSDHWEQIFRIHTTKTGTLP